AAVLPRRVKQMRIGVCAEVVALADDAAQMRLELRRADVRAGHEERRLHAALCQHVEDVVRTLAELAAREDEREPRLIARAAHDAALILRERGCRWCVGSRWLWRRTRAQQEHHVRDASRYSSGLH